MKTCIDQCYYTQVDKSCGRSWEEGGVLNYREREATRTGDIISGLLQVSNTLWLISITNTCPLREALLSYYLHSYYSRHILNIAPQSILSGPEIGQQFCYSTTGLDCHIGHNLSPCHQRHELFHDPSLHPCHQSSMTCQDSKKKKNDVMRGQRVSDREGKSCN